MRSSIWLMAFLFLVQTRGSAQIDFITRNGLIRFNASTPLEDIEAENRQVNALLRPENGSFGVVLLISEFEFPRKLMQEHFNENYLESDRYPKATFSGSVQSPLPDLGNTCDCLIQGVLSIHGVERPMDTKARIERLEGGYRLRASFIIRPEDHKIEVPRMLFSKIAEEVEVEVDLNLQTSS